jgi:hypothetical protein
MPLPLIGQLLVHAATGAPLRLEDSGFLGLPEAQQQRQFRWLMRAGLGPLLYHATRAQAEAVPARWRDELLAAELTARVRHAALAQSALELIDACAALGVELTLLKGFSVSTQLWPAPHLRPMSDIDVLLPLERHDEVAAALTAAQGGHDRIDFPVRPGLHHDAPLRHRGRGTVVELHKALFPVGSPFSVGGVFAPAQVLARSEASSLQGRAVRRLPAALQLPYIAAAWFNDLTELKVDPSFLASLFDAVFLLRRDGATLAWDALRRWLDDDDGMARGCLYALLSYLPRFGVAPAPEGFVTWLAGSQRVVGPLQRRLIHWMLDHHLVAARPWSLPLPPPVPGRYSPRYQWRKRVAPA